jgi:hypothetical protein
MAAGDTAALTKGGHSAAWALPLTLSGNAITAVGTAITFKAIGRHEAVLAAVGGASGGGGGTDVISTPLADGVTVELNRVTRKIEGTTGLNKNAGGGGTGGGAAVDIVRWTSILTGRTKIVEAAGMRGKVFLTCIPSPDAVDVTEEGFYFLIGTHTSEVPVAGEPETIGTLVYEFQGGTAYTSGFAGADEAARNDALIAAITFGPITPASNVPEYVVPPITPPTLTADDLTTLLKGEIVIKAAA